MMKKKNDIPSDIIVDILSGMPVDSVLQWKRVCKTWRSLVDHDPTFVALHTHRFITSSSSSSSGGGQQLVIKSAPFSFFVMVSKYRLYSIDNDEFYFGEYPYNNINNNDDAAWKKYSVNPAPLMKLIKKPIPISHRFHHLLNVDNKKCISSCNGLILIASISHTKDDNNNNNSDDAADMFVFNPVTREYVHLPRPRPRPRPPPIDEYHHNDDGGGGIGFGYHPITNEYKVVRITSSYSSYESDYISSVYTLGSGGGIWRKSKGETKTNINLGGDHEGGNNNYNNNNNNIFHLRWGAHPAVLLNGVLHWLRNERGHGVILLFDLADEELKILPLSSEEEDPFLWEPDRINHLHLGVLEGCLCLSANNIVQNQSRVDIWVLNKLEEDHNQEEYSTAAASCSWTMKYSLPTGTAADSRLQQYEIVADLGGGKILFSRFHDGRRLGLVSYDPETDYVEELNEKRCFGISRWNKWSTINRWSAMIPYVKSFVSLKALGEEVVG